jgi:hypothetical protein
MTEETQIKHQIRDYLDLKGIFHFPVLQGLGAARGIPDRLICHHGKFIGLEVKARNGRLSPHQIQFRDRVEAAGGVYIEARSVDDIIKYFAANP